MSTNNSNSVSSANSYALALYELSEENKEEKIIEDEVNQILSLLNKNDQFNYFIKNPTSKQEDKINIINLISEKFGLNKLLKKFLNFLVIKRRLFYIESILKDFLRLCSRKRGEIEAKLSVAKELNEEDINKIKTDLTNNFGSNIRLNYKYDPTLIGGLVLQVGSVMIDTSIKNKLQKIENKMIEA